MAAVVTWALALGTWKVRAIMIALALAAAVAWRISDVRTLEARGAEKVVIASKAEGKKINAKNDAVRERSSKPGASDRMRNAFCRDCE